MKLVGTKTQQDEEGFQKKLKNLLAQRHLTTRPVLIDF